MLRRFCLFVACDRNEDPESKKNQNNKDVCVEIEGDWEYMDPPKVVRAAQ